jgi:hypothetical protein
MMSGGAGSRIALPARTPPAISAMEITAAVKSLDLRDDREQY